MKSLFTGKKNPLFWLSILFVILAAAGIITLLVSQQNEWQKEIAGQYLKRSMEKTLNTLRNLKDPVERSLIIGRKWGLSGLFNLEKPATLNAKFIPVLEELPQVAGLMLVNNAEEEYFLMPDSGYWLVRIWREGNLPDMVNWMKMDSSLHIKQSWQSKRTFIPSSRPWFVQSIPKIDSGSVNWFGPYTFKTKQKIGLTGSIGWTDAKTRLKYILAFDVLLDELLREIGKAKITPHALNFLFEPNGVVLLPVDSTDQKTPVAHFPQISNPIIRRFVKKLEEESLPPDQPIAFTSGKMIYWGVFARIPGRESNFFAATILPQSDFKNDLDQRLLMTIGWIFIILLFSVMTVYISYRKYSGRKADTPVWYIDKNNPEQSIFLLIRQGEGRFVEFKSTMRMNLKTGKTGKEIEMAWLKTVAAFLNTEGGILLLGVDDAGTILGLDADRFENDDRCRLHFKNVFNQHIGMEFTPYVVMDLYSIDGKTVAAVQCKPCPDAVFVKSKNGEEIFFIRSGPSTVKLPPSKILPYMQKRKK